MPLLSSRDAVDRLFPGFIAFILTPLAAIVTRSLWQLTGLRHYLWFVGIGAAAAYSLLSVLYLRRACTALQLPANLVVHAVAIFTVWVWLDAAFRLINCGLDRSTSVDVTATVTGSTQRKSAHVLKLSTVSAFAKAELVVDADVYDRSHIGGTVVVAWHKGLLGDGWCGRDGVRVESARLR